MLLCNLRMQLFLGSFLCILAILITSSECTVQVIRDLVQFNVAGHPVLHQESSWPFDPDIGVKRSIQYQAINGRFGEKAIERLGLGFDGHEHERLLQQRARDEYLRSLDNPVAYTFK